MNKYLLAIETGGTKLQLALGDQEGNLLYCLKTRIDSEKGKDGILTQIRDNLPLIKKEAEQRNGTIEKIGVGFGGPVDSNAGVTLWSAQVTGWEKFPLADYLTRETGITTRVFNDSNAAAWGEYKKGTGKNCSNFFYTNMGSGVGGGAVINGKLFDGQGTGAAEIGQTYLYNPDKIPGCRYPVNHLEKVCSGWSIQEKMRHDYIPRDSVLLKMADNNQRKITCEMWSSAIKQKDPYSLKILDEVCEYFALGLCNAICFYSPEVIAIGGGVSLIGDPLISRITKYVDRYVYRNSQGRYQITKSSLDENVVTVGTLLLLSEQ